MEAIAIIGCIAAVVSAYRDGGAIVDKIKQKRLAKNALPPTRLLEESLARGPKAVEEAKENGLERFGPRYAAGDQLCVENLKTILIDLQGSLLKHLWQAQEDDNMTDFTTLVDASDFGRIRTVTVLNELYMRMAMSATSAPNPFGDMGSFTNPSVAAQHGQTVYKALLPAPTTPGASLSSGHIVQPNIRQQESPENGEMYGHQIISQTTPKMGFFDRFRRKSSAEDDKTGKCNGRSSHVRSNSEATPQSNCHHRKVSQSPIVSPPASIDEDNPWATEGKGQEGSVRELRPDRSVSRATTLVPNFQQQPSTMSSASAKPTKRMLSPYELHGGFCKGAYKLQVHEKEAMKLRNQSTAKTGENYYWACCSSKCAFEGPARKVGKTWTFDGTVRECYGVRYRWSFLAKAHVALARVKDGKHDYGCVFCIYDGFECPAYHGIQEFMEHVGTHRGKSIADTMLQRIKCVNSKVANHDDDFDINLTPLEATLQPVPEDDKNALTQPSMMNATASERTTWTTIDETMANLDPWKGAT
ncbi:MAG: hypothetical protein Q9225_002224 [Loekoesia sp. 1 TL-2023]